METVLQAGESPYYLTFTILRAAIRSARIPVEHIRTVVKDDGTMVALIIYGDGEFTAKGAEQRVPITGLPPLHAMYQVLNAVYETIPLD